MMLYENKNCEIVNWNVIIGSRGAFLLRLNIECNDGNSKNESGKSRGKVYKYLIIKFYP